MKDIMTLCNMGAYFLSPEYSKDLVRTVSELGISALLKPVFGRVFFSHLKLARDVTEALPPLEGRPPFSVHPPFYFHLIHGLLFSFAIFLPARSGVCALSSFIIARRPPASRGVQVRLWHLLVSVSLFRMYSSLQQLHKQ